MAGVFSLRSENTNIPATSAGPTRRSGVPAAMDTTAPAVLTAARSHGGHDQDDGEAHLDQRRDRHPGG